MRLKEETLYLCVHKMLEQKVNPSRIISKKDFYRILGETFHVPKNMRAVVIREMIQKGLIENLGGRKGNKLKVLKIEICIERDINKLYQHAGMF